MKPLFIFYSTLLTIIILMVLDQVWFGFVPAAVFGKMMITLVIIGGLVLGIQAFKSELIQGKKDKDDGYTN